MIVIEKDHGFHGERFVTICLNVAQKLLNVERCHSGKECNIITSVLSNITIVTRSLGEERWVNLEVVVITLKVAMDTRERVVNLDARIFIIVKIVMHVTKNCRNTSTETIIEEHLTHSSVKERIYCGGFDT